MTWKTLRAVPYEPPRYSWYDGKELMAEYEKEWVGEKRVKIRFLHYRDETYFIEKARAEEFNSALATFSQGFSLP